MSSLSNAKAALRRGVPLETVAAEYLAAREREGSTFWTGRGELTSAELSGRVADVGALLALGRGREANLLRRVVVVDPLPDGTELVRAIGDVPPEEMRVYALSHLAWASLVEGDDRPLPPLPRGRGKLTPRASRAYGAIRDLFAARAAGDRPAVMRAITRLGRLEAGTPSLFAAALHAIYG